MSIWDLTDEDRRSMRAAGYSEEALDLFDKRKNVGDLDGANVCHADESPHGERVRFYINVDKDRIKGVSYVYRGCPALAAVAAATVELTVNKTIEEANTIIPSDVWRLLKSLPPGHEEQVEFCVNTMKDTLNIYSNQKRLTKKEHQSYRHFCDLTGKEIDELEIIHCAECPMVQNCENDHIIVSE